MASSLGPFVIYTTFMLISETQFSSILVPHTAEGWLLRSLGPQFDGEHDPFTRPQSRYETQLCRAILPSLHQHSRGVECQYSMGVSLT